MSRNGFTTGSDIRQASAWGTSGTTNGATHDPAGTIMTSDTDGDNAVSEPIAICGMAVRLPGGLHSPQQLWDFLQSKGDARGRVPDSRYNVSSFYSSTSKPGTVNTEYGYFLDESVDISSLDTSFFSMSRNEVARADPHQRQMLEVVRECMEDAGETSWRGRQIGCYMGSFGEDWVEMFAKETQQYGQYRVFSYGDYNLANRVSYEMDLHGPSMVIRTGCSAALVALHEACLALGRGECESAIVGGANLILAPGMTVAMAEQGVLSPDGSCKTFSADADGYARGEAISAIYVKPFSSAVRDGNPIRSLIRATATNSDGKSPGGISAPNERAQEVLIRRAYRVAGIADYSETAFVECHGTGTPVGDPVETRAVGRVFGPSGGVFIGSVKPNLGHSEGASGLTSLIKSVLALEHRIIPPNIKFTRPNPEIPFQSTGLVVPTESTPWPDSRRERISINSFGIGGSNAHIILDSARSFGWSPAASRPSPTAQLLLYSANHADSLKTLVENYSDFLDKNPDRAVDLAYTLSNRRMHLPQRAFAVASALGGVTVSPSAKAGETPKLVMVFTGQGAQWPKMGQQLLRSPIFSVFLSRIREMDGYLQGCEFPPEWNIEEELQKPRKTSRLSLAELSQPLCTALQIALVDTLASIGVRPDAVVGHSSGEMAAAYAAGAITAREAIVLALHRGRAALVQTKEGAMAAISMSSDGVQEFLVPGVVVACENSTKSITLAGDTPAVEEAVGLIKAARPDVLVRMLQVDKAYHSHHMAEIGEHYYSLIEHEVQPRAPTKLFFSSVTGELVVREPALDARYWQRNLQSRVRFLSAMASILEHPVANNAAFFEIGPHSALAGPVRQIQARYSHSGPYISALVRNQDSVECFLTAIGKLHLLNMPIDFQTLVPGGSTLPDLPRYPWNHVGKFWHESRVSKEWRLRPHPYHDLLGVRVPESPEFEILFRNVFHLDNTPWIRDHRIRDDVVFPFAGYVAMAGEAVSQATATSEAFDLRHVLVSTAMVLNDSKPVEITTTLRRQRLTDSLDSEWWDFTIASYKGSTWTKHCTGEARAHRDSLGMPDDIGALLPRKITSRRCYDSMARSGLNFGPAFRRLEDVRSGTQDRKATASAVARDVDGSGYHLHPTIIDAALQLLSVAASRGYSLPGPSKMMIPTYVDKLHVRRSTSKVRVHSSASFTPNGSIVGQSQCVAGERAVLRSSGIRLSALDDQIESLDMENVARIEWAPHIDFLPASSYISRPINNSSYAPRLDELSRLCIILTQRRLAGLQASVPHMLKFRSWINRQLKAACLSEVATLDCASIQDRADALVRCLLSTPAAAAAMAINKILANVVLFFTGELEPLDALQVDKTFTQLHSYLKPWNESLLLRYLAHAKPNLRVLEICAGMGSLTELVLKELAPPGGEVLYFKYTFTDVSSSILGAAKKRFEAHSNMEYVTLDISCDPSEQGFNGRTFDLILATNVAQSTPFLEQSLRNIRKLLSTNGRLLLHEINPNSIWVNYIWGTLPGWRYSEPNGQPEKPCDGVEQWGVELRRAGFQSPDAVVLDSEAPQHQSTMILARPQLETMLKKRVTLLRLDAHSDDCLLYETLQGHGYTVDRRVLDETLPAAQDVIALLDKDMPFFETLSAARFESFKHLVGSLGDCGVLWVTHLSQMRCRDPRYAQINGVARTVRSEMLVDFATCEVDSMDASSSCIVDVFERFQAREEDEALKPEMEYVIADNTVYVGRIRPFSIRSEIYVAHESDRVVLQTSKPGRLSALHWATKETPVLQGSDVEVEIYAAGLNFKDVLCAIDVVEAPANGFGLEAAGIVCRTAPDVESLMIGDRVMLIAHCSFATHVTVSEHTCVRIPGNLRFEDAATMPCVYSTAIYSLFNVGNLQKGQSILIHSACGGVGLAAVQLARMVGAEIYTTVGNEEKVQYLMEAFGLPRNRIFNSRNNTFVADLMRETAGRGTDLVLNSLSGELLHATWTCVAEFGKMVEIGKRDLLGFGKLDLSPFLANRSYCAVDLDEICKKKPAVAKELLSSIVNLFQQGNIVAINPIKVFDAADNLDAFRYMQQGVHLGKIVVSMRDGSGAVHLNPSVVKRKKPIHFDASASYLLVGGLGGLGRSLSTWMVHHGARHLIYLSRSASINNADYLDFVEELASMGCRTDLVPGSVTNKDDVANAVSKAAGSLKGILQMSMVLSDENFSRMTIEQWRETVNPKVQGTWNLHHVSVSAAADLDFFLLFSSLSGIVGQPGQVNYAGANTFLDAFVQYRTSLGLPVSAIDIGAVAEVGYLATRDSVRLKVTGSCGSSLSEQEFLESMAAAMAFLSTGTGSTSSSTGVFTMRNHFSVGLRSPIPLGDPSNRALYKKDIRMAVFHNSGVSVGELASGSNDTLKTFLAKARSDAALLHGPESANILAQEIGKKLFTLLLKSEEDLKTSCSLSDLGMDSLVAIEMRQWWRQALGFDISVLEMLAVGTLHALGEHAAVGLSKLFHPTI
ncbi:hypothetical protein GQ53DRAFT_870139 [Thozetella sp. PMI_491]|nr:hypothetical protein GQ53DRAFT_870139 [Thozetella sp. PMI_491]